MKTERIQEIQATTPYPDSVSIAQALLQVWNETARDYKQSIIGIIDEEEKILKNIEINDLNYTQYVQGKLNMLAVLRQKIEGLK